MVGLASDCPRGGIPMVKWARSQDWEPEAGKGHYFWWFSCRNPKCQTQQVMPPEAFVSAKLRNDPALAEIDRVLPSDEVSVGGQPVWHLLVGEPQNQPVTRPPKASRSADPIRMGEEGYARYRDSLAQERGVQEDG